MRLHLSKVCEAGRKVDLLVEASKTNEKILEECRIRFGPTLQASGLSDTTSQVKQDDPAITAAIKQQASVDLDKKRFADQVMPSGKEKQPVKERFKPLRTTTPRSSTSITRSARDGKAAAKGTAKGSLPTR